MSGLDIQDWSGRTESVSEPVGIWRATAMAATLDRPAPGLGDPLPALWHWMYGVKAVPQAMLAEDGHPQRGEFIPPLFQSQRLWAGSRLEFTDGIRIGDTLERESAITAVRETTGSSGTLVFVTLENRYSTERGLAIRELQDLVYRDAPPDGFQARQREPIGLRKEATRTVRADEPLLFRYSALTFNAHRIHYDAVYALEVEGYPGLVVHGPLLATWLMNFWQSQAGRPDFRALSIRALAPAFAGEPVELCVGVVNEAQQTLWAQRDNGDPLLRIDLDFAGGKP